MQIGIEQLTVDSKRQLAMDTATVSAHRTLPFPVVGMPYEFVLDLDEGECTSEAWTGRVILIPLLAHWLQSLPWRDSAAEGTPREIRR